MNEGKQHRHISVPIYAAAFVITTLIFAIGVYVGGYLDSGNLDNLESEIAKISYQSLSYQLMFLMGDSDSFCPFYKEELDKLDAETEKVGLKLTYLEDIKGVSDPELKKQYFVLETNAFLLSEKVKAKCGGNYTTILYFYSNKECSGCTEQGYELIKLKQELGENVRIYSFDGELGSSLVAALMKEYGVASYPSVVIGGNRTVSGLNAAGTLKGMLG